MKRTKDKGKCKAKTKKKVSKTLTKRRDSLSSSITNDELDELIISGSYNYIIDPTYISETPLQHYNRITTVINSPLNRKSKISKNLDINGLFDEALEFIIQHDRPNVLDYSIKFLKGIKSKLKKNVLQIEFGGYDENLEISRSLRRDIDIANISGANIVETSEKVIIYNHLNELYYKLYTALYIPCTDKIESIDSICFDRRNKDIRKMVIDRIDDVINDIENVLKRFSEEEDY